MTSLVVPAQSRWKRTGEGNRQESDSLGARTRRPPALFIHPRNNQAICKQADRRCDAQPANPVYAAVLDGHKRVRMIWRDGKVRNEDDERRETA